MRQNRNGRVASPERVPIYLNSQEIKRCVNVQFVKFFEMQSNRKLNQSAGAGGLGPVVQSIVSLTSSLRGQLVKCFMTL